MIHKQLLNYINTYNILGIIVNQSHSFWLKLPIHFAEPQLYYSDAFAFLEGFRHDVLCTILHFTGQSIKSVKLMTFLALWPSLVGYRRNLF